MNANCNLLLIGHCPHDEAPEAVNEAMLKFANEFV